MTEEEQAEAAEASLAGLTYCTHRKHWHEGETFWRRYDPQGLKIVDEWCRDCFMIVREIQRESLFQPVIVPNDGNYAK